ncbi:DNA polymerase III subunit alpha [bacterium]|nr:DNA polymerase III subunit alpha [bacterium]
MGPSDFVHLHVHSDFSLLDGAAKIDGLVAKAKACGQTALALTDHGTLSGIVSFHKECKKAGIKPILGCEAYLALGDQPDAHRERKTGYNHLTLLAKNEEGWKNLSRLSSLSNLEGFYYHPRISLDLLRRHAKGLVALSGCLKGPVSVPLVQGAADAARKQAEKYREIFGDDYYLEIQPNSLDPQKVVNEGCLRLSRELGIKPVATCDLHYIEPEDAEAQEIRICIASGKTLKDEDRLKMKEDFYFKSSEEMQRAFSHVPEAILSTREIAEKVSGDWKLLFGASGQYFLPRFVPEDGSEARAYLRRLATAGLSRRYGESPDATLTARLDYELSVIEKQGLVDYFLIVQDFINWARKNGCPVGPGRGSAAGSIVAYSIGITDIDPIKYDLLFERFLNPDRVSMPDIDVDFCEANRGKVIEYVRRKYGEKNVCQIITFGTLKAKAVIRDVGRVLDIPLPEVDKIAKLVPEGPKTTLESALAETPDLAKLRDEPAYRRLFDLALKLEGINRHEGRHAAGVVISDTDLLERIPLTRVGSGDDKAVATQFTMTEVEEVGLLKMDFLGLRTLTLIHDCLELVRRTSGKTVDENAIPLDDAKTFELLQRGEARGVFQLESSGMRRLLVELRPDRFEDIIALIALFRPGPLESGMAEAFVRRKHGEKVVYEHPTLEPILKDTYGCFVYQEQIMLLANKVAGFSLSEADMLRKAMGKKKVDLMEKYKSKFISGCEKTGLDPQKAATIWDQIAKFAEYAFNRSHSAAYGLITYRTAWLKANYPVEFMAATLTSWSGDTDKLVEYVDECQRMGISLDPPDVSAGMATFDVREGKEKKKRIVYGLEAIKGVGSGTVAKVLEARAHAGGRFRSIFHFTDEVESHAVNRATLEALVKAGAFSKTGARRSQLVLVVERALEMGAQAQKDRLTRQTSLFAQGTADEEKKIEDRLLPEVPEWSDAELLKNEKEALGFYLTKHPLEQHRATIERFATARTCDLAEVPEGADVTLGGLLTQVKPFLDKKGNTMAFIALEDFSGKVEGVVFGSLWPEVREHVRPDAAVFLQGKLDKRREAPSIRVEAVVPLAQAEGRLRVAVDAELPLEEMSEEKLLRLRALVEANKGDDAVYYTFRRQKDGSQSERFRLAAKVRGSDSLKREMIAILGPGAQVQLKAMASRGK